jgi:ribosome recycling factor
VLVEAYGSKVPLAQVASVSAPEPRMLVVQVWDAGMAKAVEKGIRDANLGVNPASEGTSIRVRLPELSQERRQELVKTAHKYAENTRISIRNIRRDGMDTLKKLQKDGLSEDEEKRQSKALQETTDQHVKQVDEALVAKEKDILQV